MEQQVISSLRKSFIQENNIQQKFTITLIDSILFRNGYLDPWSGGGVYETSPGIKHANKNGVYTFYMQDSAHHLDLRQPNTCDPPSVTNARFQVIFHIYSLLIIDECYINKSTFLLHIIKRFRKYCKSFVTALLNLV